VAIYCSNSTLHSALIFATTYQIKTTPNDKPKQPLQVPKQLHRTAQTDQNSCTKRLKTVSRRAPQPHYLKRQILNQSPFLTHPLIFLNYPSISYGFYNLDAFYLEFGISTTITRSPPFRKEKTLATNLKIRMCIINFSRLLHMIFVHMQILKFKRIKSSFYISEFQIFTFMHYHHNMHSTMQLFCNLCNNVS